MNEARSPRRIVLVMQTVAIGGMETHAVDLAAEYVSRGIAVLAVVPEGPDFNPLAERFDAAGAAVSRLNTDARAGRARQLRGIVRLASALRSFGPQAVHVHTGGATGGLAPAAVARLTTRATVGITEHDVPGEQPGRPQKLARALLDRMCHLVVAVSRRNAAIRDARLPVRSRSFAVVLNGVPISAVEPRDPSLREQQGLNHDDVVIGSLVRLAEGKGLETLLAAFAALRKQYACKLLLVGDGPLRGELEAAATHLGIREDVVFAGQRAQPRPFLLSMDVFCLAVPAGSMSIALLEAMALGLPPVITFGGPEEAVIDEETGLLAEPSNPAALAAALARLASDAALRRRLGAAAGEHVRVNFSTARVADDLLEAFATARAGRLVPRLRADAPPDRHPGTHRRPDAPKNGNNLAHGAG